MAGAELAGEPGYLLSGSFEASSSSRYIKRMSAQHPAARDSKPRFERRCIFCHERRVSKEHLWGKWIRKIVTLRNDPTRRGLQKVSKMDQRHGLTFEDGHFTNSGGGPFATTKVVCEACNNSWMSQIEDDMRKFYLRFRQSQHTVLSAEECLAVARWVFLKSALHLRAIDYYQSVKEFPEAVAATEEAIEQLQERWSYFYEERIVPEDTNIFVSRSFPGDGFIVGGANSHWALTTSDFASVNLIYTVCLCFGHFNLIATNHKSVADYIGNVDPERSFGSFFNKVYPGVGWCHLPVDRNVSIAEIDRIPYLVGTYFGGGPFLASNSLDRRPP